MVKVTRKENMDMCTANIGSITIPVEEYKLLVQSATELNIIYHKSLNSEDFELGAFVKDVRNAVHPILNITEDSTDAE